MNSSKRKECADSTLKLSLRNFYQLKVANYLFCVLMLLMIEGVSSFQSVYGQTALDARFQPSVEQLGGDVTTAIVQQDGKVLVGGYFRFVGSSARANVARLNADGTLDTSFNPGAGANTTVNTIAVQQDGKILIGGYFNSFNGVNAGRIVRLNSDGSLDNTFNIIGAGVGIPSATGVKSIVLQADGKILVGGNFTNFNGATVNNLVRLNADGTTDLSFNASGQGVNDIVSTINVRADGKILVGSVAFVQGAYRGRVVCLNADGSPDNLFNVSNYNGELFTSAFQTDGKILVGGNFPDASGTFAVSLVRLNVDGTRDTTFNARTNAGVYSIFVQPDGKIVIGGEFETWNNSARNRIARLNSDGSLDSSFAPNAQIGNSVRVIVKLNDNKFLAGGVSTPFSDIFISRLARLDADGNLDSSFNTRVRLNSYAEAATVQPDGKILVGGFFSFLSGVARNNIARLNTDGSVDSSFNADINTNSTVYAIAAQSDGKILVGGTFETINGTSRRGIARLNSNGSVDTSFNPGSGISGGWQIPPAVNEIVVQSDGKILIGGGFANYDGVSRKALVRLNSDGSLDNTFDTGGVTGGSEIVSSIVLQPDGKLLIGGNFGWINGVRRLGLARLNANGSLDASFNNQFGFDNSVHAIALQPDGRIIVGGIFESFNGVSYKSLIRLNADGSPDTSFNVGSGFSDGAGFGYVGALAVQTNGRILVGGNFTFYNGTSSNYIARLNADGSRDTSFKIGTGADSRINALAQQPNGDVIIVGQFVRFNNQFRGGVARLFVNNQTQFDFDGDGKSDISTFRPSNGNWYLLRSQSGFAGVQFGANQDLLTPADYDGDGKTDVAVFRPSNGGWYILRSGDGTVLSTQFGAPGDLPRPGDFDGDGKADISVFRPTNGQWYRLNSSNNQFAAVAFGAPGDVPLIGDFDADGKTDFTVFRPSNGNWYLLNSGNGQFVGIAFGTAGDIPAPADFDGDGKTDINVFRPSNGGWYRLNSINNQFVGLQFGINGDIPTAADYDGDGKADISVFRSSNGEWYRLNSVNSSFSAIPFGTNGDLAIPAAFVQ